MDTFSEAVRQWETFYLLTGTAAVTLIGLLFIAISINIELFQNKFSTDLQLFAALTFNCFFYVLILAILFEVPGISSLGLGISILLLGILGMLNAIIQQRRTRKSHSKEIDRNLATRFTAPIFSLALMSLLAVCILLQIEISLYGFIVIIILLLGSASQNAWSLLIEIKK
jgi:hypothetical protein